MTERRRYVDTHVHFWDKSVIDYPWLEGESPIAHTHRPADLERAREGVSLELAAIVFEEADCLPAHALQEAEWITSMAQEEEPRIRGIVASAALEEGEGARPLLQALAKLPLVKGIRRLIQGESLGFCTAPDFVRGVQLLPEYGFSFDLCIYHPQMGDVLELVEQCPDVTFLLDHIGKPGIAAGVMQPWKDQLRELASRPDIHCKLSGVTTEADHQNWNRDELRPYIEHVLDCFGPDRVVFGSDWPVVNLAADYVTWFDIVQDSISHLSAEDQQKIMHDNGVRFYRLNDGG
jgi:L-fuconolactonase